MDGNLIANKLAQLHLSADEVVAVMYHLGGKDDFLGQRIRESGMLPDNHEEIAFNVQETLRKLHRRML